MRKSSMENLSRSNKTMAHEQYKFTWAAASILALVVAFSGCSKKESTQIGHKQQSDVKSGTEVTPESLGLIKGTEKMGKDPLGRYWFKSPGDSDRWMYDPKDKTLHKSTKSSDGQWKLENPDGVTAESLGLGPGTEDIGKDPLGRYWFKIPGPETRVYDPKEKQLYRAKKEADGQWTMEKIASSRP